jgi:hypothetical protein
MRNHILCVIRYSLSKYLSFYTKEVLKSMKTSPENVEVSSLDVDSVGQLWVVTMVTSPKGGPPLHVIQVYMPGYHATVYTSAGNVLQCGQWTFWLFP